MLQILHNPRCGKSRDCLLFATEKKVAFEVILYLENPLTVNDLKELVKKLKVKPIELVRQKETAWIENYKDKKLTNIQILKAIAKYPILMQRPIIIDGEKAIIARETDRLEDFLSEHLTKI
ncbi:ArsC/Spx/MgsR family protein [Flavobacterium sp.]